MLSMPGKEGKREADRVGDESDKTADQQRSSRSRYYSVVVVEEG